MGGLFSCVRYGGGTDHPFQNAFAVPETRVVVVGKKEADGERRRDRLRAVTEYEGRRAERRQSLRAERRDARDAATAPGCAQDAVAAAAPGPSRRPRAASAAAERRPRSGDSAVALRDRAYMDRAYIPAKFSTAHIIKVVEHHTSVI